MLKIVGLLLVFLVEILEKSKCYTTIETNIVDEYVNGYYRDIYIDDELLLRLKSEESGEYIKNALLNGHRIDTIEKLGGSGRIIELIELLKNSKNEQDEEEEKEESNYGYGYELKDSLDKLLLTSRLDNDYHDYLENNESKVSDKKEQLKVKNLELKFRTDLRNIFDIKSQRQYEFGMTVYKLLTGVGSDLKKEKMNLQDKIAEFTNGFYIDKGSENMLKIESPCETINFKELVLIDKINISANGRSLKKSNNDLLKGYPICEVKCVIRELQNKIQWSESINRLSNENINHIKSYNWCNKLMFHNCVDLGIESFELSIMSSEMKSEIEQVKNSIDSKVKTQIENYFLNNVGVLTVPFEFNIVTESLVLNDLLEKNGFVIKRNINNDLIIKYEKISKYSKNIVSLEEILNNVNVKLELDNERKNNFADYNSHKQHSVLLSNKYINKNSSKAPKLNPIENKRLIFNIEHVTIFIQNVLLVLKAKNKINYYLPWYVNKSGVRNMKKKQDELIAALFKEYESLLRLLLRNRYIGKDMFYRMGLFNVYSLISHFKSYNINYVNTGTNNIYYHEKGNFVIDESSYFVVNTRLNYEDQVFITNIYTQNSMFYRFNALSRGNYISEKLKKLEHFKPINEYYTNNSEDVFTANFNDGEYFDDFNYFMGIKYYDENLVNKAIEISRPMKIVDDIKGNLNFNYENIVFQNNMGNYGFNIAFLNYMYQYTLNLDDDIIESTPWWMGWQSQFYPAVSFGLNNKIEGEFSFNEEYKDEDGYEYGKGSERDYFLNLSKRDFNSTLIELPINSDFPISFFDLGSYLPKDIISKEMLESIITEEVEFISPSLKAIDSLLDGRDRKFDLTQLTKEKQQTLISSWKRSDLINDPNNMLFYNHNKLNSKREFSFNPCMLNTFFDNDSSEWFSTCVKKWEIYTILFDHFTLKANRYFKISTFFDVIREVKTALTIQKAIK
ncbi:hypothetical protein FG386_000509 [Cryptosporidium ryanae]|uniref:uncharacterized protein n=1 Tax=Cryptosporidium ryanae TaxID=515981 RepID=UPI00351A42A0|nr:hypothetical protein FG386_000509 [Cryptosporidium ryanae]